ncbi:solute carrier family 39 (zinc transporter), member 1/2/3 [Marchantia polymorpha subsp. ruderalis]|uniref:Uncharacterized protein n=2 Tax=Marchantia polymorpha TaxID=3197 RepID=A0AAF6BBK0_MARPO|nr:hypothetical protein MARPO_0169s0010 [Marchantia polymorpha]BBN09384.1 hypothetical protein Mp_4g19340 [Marchantia polymorpha subsp. ruderalis]|eukprot:PTQ28245.1 hypothetical protein MARPO_0169s0010 [Marchantia polymorpha]
MRISPCNQSLDMGCFDPDLAYSLKTIAIAVVFLTGSLGVAIPLVGMGFKFLKLDGNFFSVTKAFAAGVILSTGFVHILPDAQEALSNPCLPQWPWSQFPFAGFVAMSAALLTLLTETLGTEYYENQHSHSHGHTEDYEKLPTRKSILDSDSTHEPLLQNSSTSLAVAEPVHKTNGSQHHEKHTERSHTHTPNGGADEEAGHNGNHLVLANGNRNTVEDLEVHIHNIVISQVLEVAVIAHSFIIGLSLGVSENPCAIKPLLAALSFHQLFEGFALGGCISQAGFGGWSAFLKAGAFAVTTPIGIVTGMFVASSYRANTPRALIVEGLFDAASAGILIYMALVDLIATDFRSERMRSNIHLKCMAFLALLGGTLSMSAIAFWL